MSGLKLNLSDYKSAGTYFVEVDNTARRNSTRVSAARLAVGFNMTGPFNRPVYLSDATDVTELFGGINRKLERNGCFTNRNIRTMVAKAPIFALNLMPINTVEKTSNLDTVGFSTVSFSPDTSNYEAKTLYAYMYDRSNFWVADENAFVNNVFITAGSMQQYGDKGKISEKSKAPMFGISNCGTNDFSVIVRKAEGMSGYNMTFAEWYGSVDNIPYKWINPNDFVSDYFIQVIAIKGNWDGSTCALYATDPVWKEYFDNKGLKAEKLNKFLRLDAVNVIGNWTGCIVPDFVDKQGNSKSIDYLINKSFNTTGVMFGINTAALDMVTLTNKKAVEDVSTGAETIESIPYVYIVDENGDGYYREDDTSLAYFKTDMVGHLINRKNTPEFDTSTLIGNFMSYIIDASDFEENVFMQPCIVNSDKTSFTVDSSSADFNINIGDLVRAENGLMCRITKKRCVKNADTSSMTYTYKLTYTTNDNIKEFSDSSNNEAKIEIHKPISEMSSHYRMLAFDGLKISNRHMPGYDEKGVKDAEKGVEKIYKMLEDYGIRKGLLNSDIIDYRYIVDTMAYGLGAECGAKKYLTKLAMDKKHCSALCNIPAMNQFASSDAPFFGDTYDAAKDGRPVFNVKYLVDGGNIDMPYSTADVEFFTMPTVENGSQYCAFFTPFFKYKDGTKTILVPPAADISNTIIDRFQKGKPYAATVNTDGVINNINIDDVEYPLDETDRGYLEEKGINALINHNGAIMIYGNKTAYQDIISDLNNFHVRELLNTLEINCKNVLDPYVFKYNTPAVRAEITGKITPILSNIKDAQAIKKFEVICNETNNTTEIINSKFCIVDIYVWVSELMEKIVTRITLNRDVEE